MQTRYVVCFLSNHKHRFFLKRHCVKWSVKWVHLTSLQWIMHIILHKGLKPFYFLHPLKFTSPEVLTMFPYVDSVFFSVSSFSDIHTEIPWNNYWGLPKKRTGASLLNPQLFFVVNTETHSQTLFISQLFCFLLQSVSYWGSAIPTLTNKWWSCISSFIEPQYHCRFKVFSTFKAILLK